MSLFANAMLVAVGLALLFAGGELLVRGAVSTARRLGVSELVIGLTIVGFGTSMPEMLVSVEAAFKGSPEIALGNVVGSNIANILLIVGCAALVMPLSGWDRSVRRDVRVMLGASVLLFVVAACGVLPRWTGAGFLVLLGIYLYAHYRASRVAMKEHRENASSETPDQDTSIALSIGLILGGFVLLFAGANWLIDGAVAIARIFGISEAVIGLTIVAVGTSLPELTTSVVAAWRGQAAVALGNVVGSNIFNVLSILGVTALIKPLPIAERFLWFDIPFMLAISIVFAGMLVTRNRFGRFGAAIMLAVYAGYTVYLYIAPA
ncbi:calcium/sodium antiporter [Mesorhizobium xinjiangense]|uniref:calcium/sodium antiporter n=1 Tax=Mesorhizobium xinjiangense TaxID=2678685 RepID=UPI0012EE1D37|nr:calcium/sodium antiporter [Mesorhizobium xinjiangense]